MSDSRVRKDPAGAEWGFVKHARRAIYKIGPNTTAWLCGDVRRCLRNLSKSNAAQSQSLVIEGKVSRHE